MNWTLRQLLDAILYLLRTVCPWGKEVLAFMSQISNWHDGHTK
ncbi:hypothetical protein E1297_01700 [Roseibium sp. RKSG952]|nr:hypothetical protein [Roseibium sp. RKSG952]